MFRRIIERFPMRSTSVDTLDVHGEVAGSAAEEADYLVVLSRKGDNSPIATAVLRPNGTFLVEDLPSSLRGETLDITTIDSTGASRALASIQVPSTGNAVIRVRQPVNSNKVESEARELEQRIERKRVQQESFRQTRKKLETVRPEQPSWDDARKTMGSWGKLRFARPSLRIAPEKVKAWNRNDIFKKPSTGFDINKTKKARVLLTLEKAAEIGASPTLCQAVLAGEKARGFERSGRLVDRFLRRANLENIKLPEAPAGAAAENPPEEFTIAELEESVDREILKRAGAAISDLKDSAQPEPTTADDLLRLRAIVEKLELAQGTANVVAAREVHSLQIAFLNETANNDDNDMLGWVAELEVLKLRMKKEYDVDLPNSEASSRDEYIDHLALIKQRIRTAIAIEPVPRTVLNKRPDIDQMTWAKLSDDAKSIVVDSVMNSAEKGN